MAESIVRLAAKFLARRQLDIDKSQMLFGKRAAGSDFK
jgi:hypothetical protein